MVDCEADGFVCQEEAHDEGEGEGDDDAGVGSPKAEIVGGDSKNLF